jgi:hypothetical protein
VFVYLGGGSTGELPLMVDAGGLIESETTGPAQRALEFARSLVLCVQDSRGLG